MEKNGPASFIRYRTGEVRILWRVLISVIGYAVIAFLLRFIPIFVSVAVQTGHGADRQDALEAAKAVVFEHPVWSTVIGVINAFMALALVWFLMRVFEKRRMAWKDAGLNFRRGSFLCLVLGGLLALVMYAADVVMGRVLGSSAPTISAMLAGLSVSAVLGNLALYIPLGFSEELLFRGYIQTRLVERYGAAPGILVGSVVFTLLHIFGRPLSPVAVLSGVILWSAIGALYHWSRSLYLVGMFHAVMNSVLNVLPSNESELAGLLVHTLTLLLIVVATRRSFKSSYAAADTMDGGPRDATEADGL